MAERKGMFGGVTLLEMRNQVGEGQHCCSLEVTEEQVRSFMHNGVIRRQRSNLPGVTWVTLWRGRVRPREEEISWSVWCRIYVRTWEGEEGTVCWEMWPAQGLWDVTVDCLWILKVMVEVEVCSSYCSLYVLLKNSIYNISNRKSLETMFYQGL